MPLIEITLAEGREYARLRTLMHRIHEAVRDTLDVPDASVRVIVREVPPTHWSAGDVTLQERERD
ncbi:tautomerase family protein [Kitasatospora kifunensis]|uniref:4-oxalocrotonate tautomerase n=1 Tax=Kitasatospora kifunensis TaxID=58351 RepID=A0A7W7VYP1_KITKI|nr:tautomerase family protein [Kitasatospora kifunensis]MBB4927706.1 4-oxalocrotonate tautomerase [Kitasatospora kifunensis]